MLYFDEFDKTSFEICQSVHDQQQIHAFCIKVMRVIHSLVYTGVDCLKICVLDFEKDCKS